MKLLVIRYFSTSRNEKEMDSVEESSKPKDDSLLGKLGLDDEKEESVQQKIDKIQAKLGVTNEQLLQALSTYVVEHAVPLTSEFVNIAPLGDYSKLLEDSESMAQFLVTEAHKPEHWDLYQVKLSQVNQELVVFEFVNKAIDDGDAMSGFIYVSFEGAIKHVFAQGES
jgi:hypothetical protein